MLIRGLQDPEVYALGSLWFLVLRCLYDWGGLGPKTWSKSGTSPKRLRNGPAEAQKNSEMVHKLLGDGAVNQKAQQLSGRAQNGSEVVREKPEEPKKAQKSEWSGRSPKKAQKWSGRSPKRLRNGPGGGHIRWWGKPKKAQKWPKKGPEMVRKNKKA